MRAISTRGVPSNLIFIIILICMCKKGRFAGTFVQSVAVITAFAVATRAIGFVFRIFLSRILGAELLGVYQIAFAFFMIFLTMVSTGLPLAISKRVATKQSGGVITAGLIIGLGTSVVACFIVLLLSSFMGFLFTDERSIAILIALVPSVMAASVYSVIRAVWWGKRSYFLLGFTELLEQILRVVVFAIMLAFAFLFVDLGQIAALSHTFAFIIAAVVVVIMYIKTRKIDSGGACPTSQYMPLLRSAAPITGVRVVSSLTMPIISILIPMRLIASGWSPQAAIASFGILVGMTLPLLTVPQTIINSLSTALVPELSSAQSEKNHEKVRRQITNALKFTLFINFLLLPVFIAIGEGIGMFLYADQRSGVYISRFAWIMVPMSMSQITIAILNSLGAESRAMKHYLIGAVALFISVWFLPQYVGIGALAIGLGACMAIASVLNLMLIAKLTKTKSLQAVFRQCIALIGIGIPSTLFGFFAFGIFAHGLGLFVSLALSSIISIVVFMMLAQIFNVVQIRYIKQALSKQ